MLSGWRFILADFMRMEMADGTAGASAEAAARAAAMPTVLHYADLVRAPLPPGAALWRSACAVSRARGARTRRAAPAPAPASTPRHHAPTTSLPLNQQPHKPQRRRPPPS